MDFDIFSTSLFCLGDSLLELGFEGSLLFMIALRGSGFLCTSVFGGGMCCLVGTGTAGVTVFICFTGVLVLGDFFRARCFVGARVFGLVATTVFFAFGLSVFFAEAVLTLFLIWGIRDFFFDISGYKIPLA